MGATVQARLDDETKAVLEELTRRLGWSASRIVREGIRLLDQVQGRRPRRMIGIGIFASGVPDRGANKKHLEGFGSNSGVGKKRFSEPKRRAS